MHELTKWVVELIQKTRKRTVKRKLDVYSARLLATKVGLDVNAPNKRLNFDIWRPEGACD